MWDRNNIRQISYVSEYFGGPLYRHVFSDVEVRYPLDGLIFWIFGGFSDADNIGYVSYLGRCFFCVDVTRKLRFIKDGEGRGMFHIYPRLPQRLETRT